MSKREILIMNVMPMRERLARVLASVANVRPAFDDPRTTDDNGINIITGRTQGFALADAVLRVLSASPTVPMIKAGEMELASNDGAQHIVSSLDVVAMAIWQAMVRTMIEEGKK